MRTHDRSLTHASRAVLLSALLTGALRLSTAAAAQGTTLVEAADGKAIGEFTGRVTAYDDGGMRGALGVLSPQGYFADLLPDGRLGQVLSLSYATPDCSGAPAIEVGSVMGGPLPVPSYVFAFGAPTRLYVVPAGAAAREIDSASVRERDGDDYRCVARAGHAQVYPVEANHAEQTGFGTGYAGPLRLRVQQAGAAPAAASATPTRMPESDETGAGGAVPPGTPQCAAGCYTSYIGDGVCESECANSLCSYDGGDCSAAYVEKARAYESTLCAPGCGAENLGDGFCDSACNVSQCQFDHGDCKTP